MSSFLTSGLRGFFGGSSTKKAPGSIKAGHQGSHTISNNSNFEFINQDIGSKKGKRYVDNIDDIIDLERSSRMSSHGNPEVVMGDTNQVMQTTSNLVSEEAERAIEKAKATRAASSRTATKTKVKRTRSKSARKKRGKSKSKSKSRSSSAAKRRTSRKSQSKKRTKAKSKPRAKKQSSRKRK